MAPYLATSGAKNLKVIALDAEGRPVADGTAVSMSDLKGKNKSTSPTKKGKALFVRDDIIRAYVVSTGTHTDTLKFNISDPEASVLTIVVNALTREPISKAVLRSTDGNTVTGDPGGKIRSTPIDTVGAIVYAPGYEPAPLEHGGKQISDDRVMIPVTDMTPLFEGILHGKRIVIDPVGGGTDDAGRGAGALRGATVNMRLAKELEKLLTEAGARVVVTRNGEEQLSDQQRIFKVNRFGADLAIGLRFGNDAQPDHVCTVYHYPGSVSGTASADSLASNITGTPPCESFITAESSDLFLQQTNCPAVVISGGSLSDPDTETILGSFRWIRLEADAIRRGLLGHFSAKD